jgi:hypothetical protein
VEGQADLLEVVDALAAARGLAGLCTAGNSRAIRTAMMAMTTSNSISVKPARRADGICGNMSANPRAGVGANFSPSIDQARGGRSRRDGMRMGCEGPAVK